MAGWGPRGWFGWGACVGELAGACGCSSLTGAHGWVVRGPARTKPEVKVEVRWAGLCTGLETARSP